LNSINTVLNSFFTGDIFQWRWFVRNE